MKIMRSVSLELEAWQNAVEQGINISKACNQGLIDSLKSNRWKDMSLEDLEREKAKLDRKAQLDKELRELEL